jgi:hypothetical protein
MSQEALATLMPQGRATASGISVAAAIIGRLMAVDIERMSRWHQTFEVSSKRGTARRLRPSTLTT